MLITTLMIRLMMITKDDDYDNDDVDDDDYGDDDQADDDIDDLLMHSRTLNHSRLRLLTSNDRFRQNLPRAITDTKVKIPLLLFFNLLLSPPYHQHLDPVESRAFTVTNKSQDFPHNLLQSAPYYPYPPYHQLKTLTPLSLASFLALALLLLLWWPSRAAPTRTPRRRTPLNMVVVLYVRSMSNEMWTGLGEFPGNHGDHST